MCCCLSSNRVRYYDGVYYLTTNLCNVLYTKTFLHINQKISNYVSVTPALLWILRFQFQSCGGCTLTFAVISSNRLRSASLIVALPLDYLLFSLTPLSLSLLLLTTIIQRERESAGERERESTILCRQNGNHLFGAQSLVTRLKNRTRLGCLKRIPDCMGSTGQLPCLLILPCWACPS